MDRRKAGTSRPPTAARKPAAAPRHGLARVLSKLGVCSRSQAQALIQEGRVRVDGRLIRNPERPTDSRSETISVDGNAVRAAQPVYLAMNKPRGLVVSADDERGRQTVYQLLDDPALPWLGPVGRLDKASEGLLLLSNDTVWAAGITDPVSSLEKTYHVQIAGLPDSELLRQMLSGVNDGSEALRARRVQLLRQGQRNTWLEVTLDEGRNRHIRRLLAALGFEVLRLLRVSIGSVALGQLAKGSWRHLEAEEVAALKPGQSRDR
ncbi:MAG: rRNA pseudouridine synthase [Gammaproteobacteria bacterium]|nr:rRNA pseudouridine synthase [Gammaproteobacteria bacterium]